MATRMASSRSLEWFTTLAGAVVCLSGALVLLGWALDVAILKSVVPGWPRMVPATAAAFLLSGLGLLCVAGPPKRPARLGSERLFLLRRRAARVLAGAVTLLGSLRLYELLTSADFGIFQITIAEAGVSATAQMSPATAINFLILGLALLLAGSSRWIGAFQALTMLVLLIAWLSLGRYLYGGEPLVAYAQMAAHTALLFFVLSLGVLSVRHDGGLVALLVGDTEGGALARRLLPPALLVPILMGWLRLKGQLAGWYGTEPGLLLFAVSNVIVFGALVWINAALLQRSDLHRRLAERKTEAQLERLNLLHQITRAIGERQDLRSIFQVVVRSIEEQLPLDFSCVCLRDQDASSLTVMSIGRRSESLAIELSMPEQAQVAIDENGLSRCVRGQLVYEPDIVKVDFPFPQRLVRGGLAALVVAPLLVESQVFGVLVAARRQAHSFSSGECEFLRQLSEHVALAAHQAQLHGALQQAYDDLRQTQLVVMQQERLRALGQMASGIAHDINNAISPVSLYTEALLENEPNLSDRARGYLETIRRAIDDVADTVTRMREFYRQRGPQLTLAPVDLNQLAQQVVDLTRARWNDMPQQQGIVVKIQTKLAPDLPATMGSESEIREALINLVFNAVDAMPEGGTLTIRTAVEQGPPGPDGDPAPRRAQVEVSDTGVGMDEDTRVRCLEPFFTTKGERGTGLGLATVYGVVQRHSAELEIESTPGEGTTMRLLFLVATDAAAEPSAAGAWTATPQRLRILLVDDDPLLLRSLSNILETDGHVVTAADGGRAGIEAFREAHQSGTAFAVVITDLGMPHLDGRSVAKAVKADSPTTPVVLLTGWGQRLVDEGEVPPHVDRVLSKPPKLHELRKALAQCCGSAAS